MSKWLPDVSPTDRAVEVAARSIAIRLDHVQRYLKLAVKEPDRPEFIHQLRVWSRRSDSALSTFADLLPPKRSRWMVRTLKRIRRAAGRIRDCDIYVEKMSTKGGRRPAGVRSERIKAQRKLVALFEDLDCGRKLRKRTRRLIDRLHARNGQSTETYLHRARAALRPTVVAFFEAVPGEDGSDKQLHRLRIAGKDLRYGIELLSGAFPPAFREELYPAFTTLQEKLGTINDLSVTVVRLKEQAEDTGDPSTLSELTRRSTETNEQKVKARNEFRAWWTPEMAALLSERFDKYLKSEDAFPGTQSSK